MLPSGDNAVNLKLHKSISIRRSQHDTIVAKRNGGCSPKSTKTTNDRSVEAEAGCSPAGVGWYDHLQHPKSSVGRYKEICTCRERVGNWRCPKQAFGFDGVAHLSLTGEVLVEGINLFRDSSLLHGQRDGSSRGGD